MLMLRQLGCATAALLLAPYTANAQDARRVPVMENGMSGYRCAFVAIPGLTTGTTMRAELILVSQERPDVHLTIRPVREAFEGTWNLFGKVWLTVPTLGAPDTKLPMQSSTWKASFTLNGAPLPSGLFGYYNPESVSLSQGDDAMFNALVRAMLTGGTVGAQVTRVDGSVHGKWTFQVPSGVIATLQAANWKCD